MSKGQENLKPFSERTEDEQRKIRVAGGKASGRARREKKTMKAMLDYLLEKKITNNNGKKATTLEAMMTAIIARAIKGDVKAAQFVRDTIGEVPTQTVTNTNINLNDADVVNEVLNKLKDL